MRPWLIVALMPAFLALAAVLLVIALLLIKVMWAWTVPDLFPGAVQQGLVAREITWYAAFKLAIFVAVLGAFIGARGGGKGN